VTDINIATTIEKDTVASQNTETSVVAVPTEKVVIVVEQDVGIVTHEQEQVAVTEKKDVIVIASCAVGPPGAKGDVGDTGDTGDTGPVGPTGPSGAGASAPLRAYVPVSTTAVIESLSLSVYRSAKWIVTVTDRFNNKYRMGEVLAFHDGTDARFVHYAIFGDAVLYVTEVVIIGSDMVLRVTNADAVELVVDAVRVGHLAVII